MQLIIQRRDMIILAMDEIKVPLIILEMIINNVVLYLVKVDTMINLMANSSKGHLSKKSILPKGQVIKMGTIIMMVVMGKVDKTSSKEGVLEIKLTLTNMEGSLLKINGIKVIPNNREPLRTKSKMSHMAKDMESNNTTGIPQGSKVVSNKVITKRMMSMVSLYHPQLNLHMVNNLLPHKDQALMTIPLKTKDIKSSSKVITKAHKVSKQMNLTNRAAKNMMHMGTFREIDPKRDMVAK